MASEQPSGESPAEPKQVGDDSLLGAPSSITEPLVDPRLRYLETHRMENSADFERLIAQLAVHVLGLRNVKRYGTAGQAQHGIDIVGIARDDSVWGLQAKRYWSFGPADLRAVSSR